MPVLTNIRHELFAQAVAKGDDLVSAYAAAGFRPHESSAARLRGDARVNARIEELLKDAAVQTGITVERITQEVAAIAFLDIREAAEWGVRMEPVRRSRPGPPKAGAKPRSVPVDYLELKPSKDLPGRVARAIAMVKRTKYGVEIRPYNKLDALIRLGNQLGMWKTDEKDKGVNAIIDAIVMAHKASQGDLAKVIEGERADDDRDD